MTQRKNKPEDIWKRINKKSSSECWEWQGHISSNGYGGIIINTITYSTHRIMYKLAYGSLPKLLYINNEMCFDAVCVCHSCDNRKCCNPNHLFLGTNQDNINDKVSKNRQSKLKGELHSLHKLTQIQVDEIRELYHTGNYQQKDLVKIFDTGKQNISNIINNRRWVNI